MISITRPAAPDFLLDPHGLWQKETIAAITHYQNGIAESFVYKMYNDSRLKDILKTIFVKCAYCETVYGAGYDGDVEHFRPKGRIKEKNPPTPGYYWLANDWDNLLLSCQHCNQRRRHILYGDDKLEGYGKLDQFPLAPGTKRVVKPGDISSEEGGRLLINPCKDDPRQHLAYEDKEAVIVPLTPKGENSVKVYVLQRPILVQERKKQMLRLFKQIKIVKLLLEHMNADPSDQNRKDVFEFAFESLMNYTKAEEPYAGMCRYFVKKFLKENQVK